jgi:predicted DNA-binding protein YlxM (UPF0122 family)
MPTHAEREKERELQRLAKDLEKQFIRIRELDKQIAEAKESAKKREEQELLKNALIWDNALAPIRVNKLKAELQQLKDTVRDQEFNIKLLAIYIQRRTRKSAKPRSASDPLPEKIEDMSEHFDGAKLTAKQQECLSLIYEYNLTKSETAARLHIHRTSLDSRYALGMLKLQRNGAHLKLQKQIAKKNKAGRFEE